MITYAQARLEIEQKGGKLLTADVDYEGAGSKVEVVCGVCSSMWSTKFSNIHYGSSWCHRCARLSRTDDIKTVIKRVESMGGKLLSSPGSYETGSSIIDIECKNKHIWSTKYAYVKRGSWCNLCAIEVNIGKQRYRIEDIIKRIEGKGGRLITDPKTYDSKKARVKIQCSEGHIWEAPSRSVFRNRWCHRCSGTARKTNADMKGLLQNINATFVSGNVTGYLTKVVAKCNVCNVDWKVNCDSLQAGHGCPNCAFGKSQKNLSNIIQDLFPECTVRSNYKGFKWLYNRSTKGTQEIDIWVPELKLGIEFDGKQHYEIVNFGGISDEVALENLKQCKKRDYRKNRLMKRHTKDINHFIRFNYKEKITAEYVKGRLIKIGVKI